MPDPTDLPTLEQVTAYLEARGAEPAWASATAVAVAWTLGNSIIVVPKALDCAHSKMLLRRTLSLLGRLERRLTPGQQVARDMRLPKQSQRGAAKRQADLRDEVVRCAQAWDDAPGDIDLCVALSDACRDERQGPRPEGAFQRALREVEG